MFASWSNDFVGSAYFVGDVWLIEYVLWVHPLSSSFGENRYGWHQVVIVNWISMPSNPFVICASLGIYSTLALCKICMWSGSKRILDENPPTWQYLGQTISSSSSSYCRSQIFIILIEIFCTVVIKHFT